MLTKERKNNLKRYEKLTKEQQNRMNTASMLIMNNILLSERPEPRVLFTKILNVNYIPRLKHAINRLKQLLEI